MIKCQSKEYMIILQYFYKFSINFKFLTQKYMEEFAYVVFMKEYE